MAITDDVSLFPCSQKSYRYIENSEKAHRHREKLPVSPSPRSN